MSDTFLPDLRPGDVVLSLRREGETLLVVSVTETGKRRHSGEPTIEVLLFDSQDGLVPVYTWEGDTFTLERYELLRA